MPHTCLKLFLIMSTGSIPFANYIKSRHLKKSYESLIQIYKPLIRESTFALEKGGGAPILHNKAAAQYSCHLASSCSSLPIANKIHSLRSVGEVSGAAVLTLQLYDEAFFHSIKTSLNIGEWKAQEIVTRIESLSLLCFWFRSTPIQI